MLLGLRLYQMKPIFLVSNWFLYEIFAVKCQKKWPTEFMVVVLNVKLVHYIVAKSS